MEVLKETRKLKISAAEQYFIQFLFMENRNLLGYRYKDLYMALLDSYETVYQAGRKAQIDLADINKKFKTAL